MLVVHAGNRIDGTGADPLRARFPDSVVGAVTDRVARLLDALQPTMVLSAPAAGADLVVLGEAQRAGIPVHVLLPLREAEFERRSVADRGVAWVSRFHEVLAAARADHRSVVDERAVEPVRGWWRAANDELVTLALRLGAPRLPLALTIRPVGGEQPPSGTDHFAAAAEQAGIVVLTLDPRPCALRGGVGLTVG